MKAVAPLVLCAAVASWMISNPAPEVRTPGAEGGTGARATELPRTLASHYPPTTSRPVYLQRMLALSLAFSGIAADLLEADLDHARSGFEDFRRQYVEAAGLVPEWETRYPMEPLEALGKALAEADTGRSLQAVEALGAACHACHLDAMVPVQQLYRWKSFASISCKDRETGETLSYVKLMRDLDLGLSGIATDVSQGQAPQARAYFGLFRTRFHQLEDTCLHCHAGKRRYYVDETVHVLVDELGAALDQDAANPERVGLLVQDIGKESCGGCHLVHLPAAVAHGRGAH